MIFLLISEDDKVKKRQQCRSYILRLESDNEEAVLRLDLVDAWNAKVASVFTTWDGRDRIEAVEANIAASKTEGERAHHRSELKRRWPEASIEGTSREPEWGKHDLVDL